jgi:hypothetical protein
MNSTHKGLGVVDVEKGFRRVSEVSHDGRPRNSRSHFANATVKEKGEKNGAKEDWNPYGRR